MDKIDSVTQTSIYNIQTPFWHENLAVCVCTRYPLIETVIKWHKINVIHKDNVNTIYIYDRIDNMMQ